MTPTHLGSPVERVRYGPGSVRLVPEELDRAGASRVVVASSATLARDTELVAELEQALGERRLDTFTGLSQHTPESAVEELAGRLEQLRADGLVSLGGGSVIDGCKAALHLAHLSPALHLGIPTTLSGAEFTVSAGITDRATQLKRSLRDPATAPKVVILDPEMTLATPIWLWLASGVRALDHAVETIWAPEQDQLCGLLALEALARLRRWLPRCRAEPGDLEARYQAQIGAWWAALGLAGVSMGPSHTLGRILGARFQIPHGVTSCVLLPWVIEELAASQPQRVAPLAGAFGVGGPAEVSGACRELVAELGLPTTLAGAGLSRAQLEVYLMLVPEELRGIVRAAY